MNKIIFLLIIYINNFIYANQIFKLDGLNYNIRNGTDWEPDNCKSLKQIEEELIIKLIQYTYYKIMYYAN